MISARELDEPNIPGGGWVNKHLVYTHGFGAVVSPANSVTPEGQPAFLVKDIPPVTSVPELATDQSRIYFGDTASSSFVVVGSKEEEVDFPIGTEGENVEYTKYTGKGGVPLGGIFRRAAFALRFADLDTLISSQLTRESKVLMERNIVSRVKRIAPFLSIDADPYLVIVDDRLLWVLDLYTTTNQYPYSEEAPTDRLSRNADLPRSFNYIRNSVKATVDAFDGTMKLYVVDSSDPLIQAQQRIFPGAFVDGAQIPEQIRDHFRYPEDLFRVQSDQYQKYHITDARQFFSNVDPWEIARDPSNADRPPLRRATTEGDPRPMLPYYLLMRLPGDANLSYIIMQPFTPQNRPNMVSFLVAKSDPGEYGEMVAYRLPAASAQDGPGQVGDLINQNTDISAEFTLLGQRGSKVIQGSMLIIPIEQSLLYVQPIYIQASTSTGATAGAGNGAASGIPEFKRVVVSYDGEIKMRNSLAEAFDAVFGSGTTATPPGGGTTPPAVVPNEIASLVDAAQQALADADAALRDGDLGTYADKVVEATDLIQRAKAAIGSGN